MYSYQFDGEHFTYRYNSIFYTLEKHKPSAKITNFSKIKQKNAEKEQYWRHK